MQVLEIDGHLPVALEDFTRDVGFVVDDEARHVIHGCGRLVGDAVRFHEKDIAVNGKDIRVWTIRRAGEQFFAEQTPSY